MPEAGSGEHCGVDCTRYRSEVAGADVIGVCDCGWRSGVVPAEGVARQAWELHRSDQRVVTGTGTVTFSRSLTR